MRGGRAPAPHPAAHTPASRDDTAHRETTTCQAGCHPRRPAWHPPTPHGPTSEPQHTRGTRPRQPAASTHEDPASQHTGTPGPAPGTVPILLPHHVQPTSTQRQQQAHTDRPGSDCHTAPATPPHATRTSHRHPTAEPATTASSNEQNENSNSERSNATTARRETTTTTRASDNRTNHTPTTPTARPGTRQTTGGDQPHGVQTVRDRRGLALALCTARKLSSRGGSEHG